MQKLGFVIECPGNQSELFFCGQAEEACLPYITNVNITTKPVISGYQLLL